MVHMAHAAIHIFQDVQVPALTICRSSAGWDLGGQTKQFVRLSCSSVLLYSRTSNLGHEIQAKRLLTARKL